MKKQITTMVLAAVLVSGCGNQEQEATVDHSQHQMQPGTGTSTSTAQNDMMAEMAKGNEISQDYNFKVTADKPIVANQTTKLNIDVADKSDGMPVRDFTESHEKLMHLILVSSDMKEFQHIHPDVVGPGKLQVETTFPKDGQYIVFAQFARSTGHEATVRQTVNVGRGKSVAPGLVPDADIPKVIDGYTYKLSSYPKKANEMEMITINIEKDGKSVKGIESYLGAGGHAVVIGQDTQSFLHVHPMTEAKDGSYTAPIQFHSLIPKPGLYKLWGQFQIGGKVRTVDFTFVVK